MVSSNNNAVHNLKGKRDSDQQWFDLSVVKELSEVVSKSDLTEIEVKVGESSVRISKCVSSVVNSHPFYQSGGWNLPQSPTFGGNHQFFAGGSNVVASSNSDSNSVSASSNSAVEAANSTVVKSPMVGTVYRCPKVGEAPFFNVGDSVNEGDVLLIVESMKVMNHIKSPVSGKIVKFHIDNAKPVEYDEVLVTIV